MALAKENKCVNCNKSFTIDKRDMPFWKYFLNYLGKFCSKTCYVNYFGVGVGPKWENFVNIAKGFQCINCYKMSATKSLTGLCSMNCQIKYLGYYNCTQCDKDTHQGNIRHCLTCTTIIDFYSHNSYALFCTNECAKRYTNKYGKNKFDQIIKEDHFVECEGSQCDNYYNTYYGVLMDGYCSTFCRAKHTKEHYITERVVQNVSIHSPEMENILRAVL